MKLIMMNLYSIAAVAEELMDARFYRKKPSSPVSTKISIEEYIWANSKGWLARCR
jgi:hypothetical protein